MGTLRKLAMWGSLVSGVGIAALGLWQIGRVTRAMLNPPPLGVVLEPLIPLLVGVVVALVGVALIVAGKFLKPIPRR